MSAWKPQAKNLKLDSRLEKIVLYASMKTLLKMMENAAYFILQFFFLFSRYLIFCLEFCRKNDLISKIRLISKLTTSELDQQTIAIHILPKI